MSNPLPPHHPHHSDESRARESLLNETFDDDETDIIIDLGEEEPQPQPELQPQPQASSQPQTSPTGSGGKIQIEWDIRSVLEIALRVHDSLIGRHGRPVPMSPQEIADLLKIREAMDVAVKYSYRRCFSTKNPVYCRSPEKNKPCVFSAEEIQADQGIVLNCRYRGKPL